MGYVYYNYFNCYFLTTLLTFSSKCHLCQFFIGFDQLLLLLSSVIFLSFWYFLLDARYNAVDLLVSVHLPITITLNELYSGMQLVVNSTIFLKTCLKLLVGGTRASSSQGLRWACTEAAYFPVAHVIENTPAAGEGSYIQSCVGF